MSTTTFVTQYNFCETDREIEIDPENEAVEYKNH